MAPILWDKPIYQMQSSRGETLTIDVTNSVSAGLGPHQAIHEVIPFLQRHDVQSIVDFGAGALRHTMPLLAAGFQVCAVEFQEAFARPACKKALQQARRYHGFSALIWPREFRRDSRKFDAALLSYVVQIMPVPDERDLVLAMLKKKLKKGGFILYLSRYGQPLPGKQFECGDGHFMGPRRKTHTFYREFSTELTHETFKRIKFEPVTGTPLRKRGNEQVFLYSRKKVTWA
jgi:hypothetical protein